MKIDYLKSLKASAEKEMIKGKFDYDRNSAKAAYYWLNDQIIAELTIETKELDLASALKC
jgi:hypothetical protein